MVLNMHVLEQKEKALNVKTKTELSNSPVMAQIKPEHTY
jgi:hypothetical protein